MTRQQRLPAPPALRLHRSPVPTLAAASILVAGALLAPPCLRAEAGRPGAALAAPGLHAVHLKALRRSEELARRAAALAEDGHHDEAELAYFEALLLLPREDGAEPLREAWREELLELIRARERVEELPEGVAEADAPPLFPEPWNLSMSASEKAVLIRLPALSLREAPLEEALAFLQAASAVHDASPLANGVALELHEPESRPGVRVSLRLVRATLEEALRQTAEQAACELRYERARVLFIPREGEKPPSLLATLAGLAEAPSSPARDSEAAAEPGAPDIDGTGKAGAKPGEPGEPPAPAPDPASLLWYRAYLLICAAEEAEAEGKGERALELYREAELPLSLLPELFPDFAPEVVAARRRVLSARLAAP